MEKEGMVKVPVTDEDRKKPYFKYYERDVISMVPEKAVCIWRTDDSDGCRTVHRSCQNSDG